ncbi:hypothetical protein [Lactobacillus helveticus]|uniref:hypothetical protein n=1 Tax=Lactobacillus helveticus TaxID=1587 RepID=UPI00027E4C7E|nr:hypothetical protein [Lactobacillus helveticus]AFR22246.1 transposase [Lactobacillus helveticus R0052]
MSSLNHCIKFELDVKDENIVFKDYFFYQKSSIINDSEQFIFLLLSLMERVMLNNFMLKHDFEHNKLNLHFILFVQADIL